MRVFSLPHPSCANLCQMSPAILLAIDLHGRKRKEKSPGQMYVAQALRHKSAEVIQNTCPARVPDFFAPTPPCWSSNSRWRTRGPFRSHPLLIGRTCSWQNQGLCEVEFWLLGYLELLLNKRPRPEWVQGPILGVSSTEDSDTAWCDSPKATAGQSSKRGWVSSASGNWGKPWGQSS